jgi:ketosteroid isomerase-like protein
MKATQMAAAALAGFLLSGCASLQPEVTTQLSLLDADRAFARLVAEQGVKAAFAQTMDPVDGVVVRPGATFTGATQIQANVGQGDQSEQMFWQPDKSFHARSADFGVTSGRFVRVINGAEVGQGRYMIVWRKDASGRWRGLMDMNVEDPRYVASPPPIVQPAPTPAPKPRPKPRLRRN